MKTEPAIIGDLVMLSDMIAQALAEACGDAVTCRLLDLPWPDEPMVHGHSAPGMDGLKEYMGEPDAVIAQLGRAPVLVTHLAQLSRRMLEALPELRLVAVSRGSPVNIDMAAAMKPAAVLVNTARRPLMDCDALHEALKSGHLREAMLETFAAEPLPQDGPLPRLPNVNLAPHITGAVVKTVRIAAAQAAEEVRRRLAGEPPLNPC